ncbi:glycosyl transferase [Spiribacter halobius]|uniref:Glycosyl transferase n=1 Tax=Sediminicurvatus halobius TaxID=2182432 RepID=A0A2U2N4Z5_9GAMM|nr:TIGR04283 family arsenosugar biosynthesis glycosyltransferase [Spiribacter halobius]PWG64147.1 glycosyl transferase [Spiribacter halobius]UEX79905.1 TIGR04283 family arsenosugar biosynthesis glycosyltransferase [Spiribacter halobius]
MRLSVIVPVLNEASGIAATLGALAPARAAGDEVLVVDGGSHDGTPELAAPLADRVLVAEPGRARQMNAGAVAARGDVLWFVHGDTRVPPEAPEIVRGALLSGRAWGRFDVAIAGRARTLRVIAWCMNRRSCLTGIATGDQALFVRRRAFEAVGGFPDQPLMEDIALSRSLRRRFGWPACPHGPVVTSGRRWEQGGVWRTILLMWRLRLRYWLGADPETLARLYRQVRERP